jgi:hypothetical protein
MELIVKGVKVPAAHSFEGIYLCADFAPSLDEYFSGTHTKSEVWQLYPREMA